MLTVKPSRFLEADQGRHTVYNDSTVSPKVNLSDQLTTDWQPSDSLYPFRNDSCEIHRRLIKDTFKNKAKTCSVPLSLQCFL